MTTQQIAEMVHLRPYVGGPACGIDGPVRVTERLSETSCPRCMHDGDPVPRTRALTVAAAHIEALAMDADLRLEAPAPPVDPDAADRAELLAHDLAAEQRGVWAVTHTDDPFGWCTRGEAHEDDDAPCEYPSRPDFAVEPTAAIDFGGPGGEADSEGRAAAFKECWDAMEPAAESPGCTDVNLGRHAYVYDPAEVQRSMDDNDGYDEWERCGRSPLDPVHRPEISEAERRRADDATWVAQFRPFIARVKDIREDAHQAGAALGLREAKQHVIDIDHAEALGDSAPDLPYRPGDELAQLRTKIQSYEARLRTNHPWIAHDLRTILDGTYDPRKA